VEHASARESTLPDGRRLTESALHSYYLDDNSTSQYNMSVITERRVVDDD
jgi:hypothetical protein